MAEFSLDLNEDQLQIQKWVHDFAENVIRPAAHEWDEREETPWPIIEEAARIGLYSFDFIIQCFSDESGLLLPVANEEMAWGDAGIALAIFGSTLGLAGIASQRHAGAADGVGPAMLRYARQDPARRLRRLRAGRRFGRVVAAHPGGLRRGQGRVGPQRDEDLDHQRGHRRPPRGGGLRRSRARFARSGQLHRAAQGTPGLSPGPEVQEDGDPGLAHRRGGARRRAGCRVTACSAARTSSTSKLARAREGKRSTGQAAMETFEASRPTVGAQALGIARAAYEYSLDYAKERKAFGRAIIENQAIAFKLADMKTRIDASRLLIWRASWMGRNGKEFTSGEGSMSKLYAGETAVLGDRAGHPDHGWLRLHPRPSRRAMAPRLEDLHHLRGHLGDPAADHRPSHLRRPYPVAELGFSLQRSGGDRAQVRI